MIPEKCRDTAKFSLHWFVSDDEIKQKILKSVSDADMPPKYPLTDSVSAQAEMTKITPKFQCRDVTATAHGLIKTQGFKKKSASSISASEIAQSHQPSSIHVSIIDESIIPLLSNK